MPHFQFVAINDQGREQRGSVEADTREQAIARLERHGLRPTQVDRVTKTFGDPPAPAAPPEPAVLSPPPADYAPPAYPRRRGRMLGMLNFLFSFLAFLFAAGTLVWVLFVKGGGTGSLDRYDFSSGSNALKSMLRMEVNHDMTASLELDVAIRRFQDPEEFEKLTEKQKTLQIKEELAWKEKERVIVLYSYEEKGKKKQSAAAFEYDKKSKRWYPLKEWMWMSELERKDEDLYKKVKKWVD